MKIIGVTLVLLILTGCTINTYPGQNPEVRPVVIAYPDGSYEDPITVTHRVIGLVDHGYYVYRGYYSDREYYSYRDRHYNHYYNRHGRYHGHYHRDRR